MGPFYHDGLKVRFSWEEVVQVVGRGETKHDVYICQTKIGIENEDLVAWPRKADAYVHNHGGFTDTAFAAGDRYNLGGWIIR